MQDDKDDKPVNEHHSEEKRPEPHPALRAIARLLGEQAARDFVNLRPMTTERRHAIKVETMMSCRHEPRRLLRPLQQR